MHKFSLKKHALIAVLALAAVTAIPHAHAGQTCNGNQATAETLKKALAMSSRTAKALDDGGQQVYILGRIGQDLSSYGLTYSHLALVTKDETDGQWTVYHELNTCGTGTSKIYQQGLLEFYGDDLFKYQAAVVTLPPAVQARVLTQVRTTPKKFHELAYSLVSYPFAGRYQNSNQWLLETLAGAMSSEFELANRSQAQAWLQAAGFVPTELTIGTLTRLGGRMFKAQVAFDDHPDELRYSSRIRTTTAESIFTFLQKRYPLEYKLETVELY